MDRPDRRHRRLYRSILVGFLPNEFLRVLGLVLVRGLDERSQVIVSVRTVATHGSHIVGAGLQRGRFLSLCAQ